MSKFDNEISVFSGEKEVFWLSKFENEVFWLSKFENETSVFSGERETVAGSWLSWAGKVVAGISTIGWIGAGATLRGCVAKAGGDI